MKLAFSAWIALSVIVIRGVDCGVGNPAGLEIQGSGVLMSEARETEAFTAVSIDGPLHVSIRQGETQSLSISAEDNILPFVRSSVTGGELSIALRGDETPTTFRLNEDIEVELTVVALNAITHDGVGPLRVVSLETDQLEINHDGVGDLEIIQLMATTLDVAHDGVGSMTLSGDVTTQIVHHDGVGEYEARRLRSQNTTIDLDGTGSATVWATMSLTGTLAGVGGVNFYGVASAEIDRTGVGLIQRLGDEPVF